MQPDESFPGTGTYGPGERELLHAVRDFVLVDRALRHSMGARMHLGETDMRAVRFVMARARADEPATPRDVARHLDISTAATTTLLDRLTHAGHVQRLAHPSDRRSKVVVPTPHAWQEAQRELAPVHDRMRAVARSLAPEDRAVVLGFLAALTAAIEEELLQP